MAIHQTHCNQVERIINEIIMISEEILCISKTEFNRQGNDWAYTSDCKQLRLAKAALEKAAAFLAVVD